MDGGELGRKSGEGFYRYVDGVASGVSGKFAGVEGSLADGEIVRRIELAIINEAYHAAGDGVAEAGDIDRAMKLGANHPYGPFERAGQLSVRAVIDGLAQYEAAFGERFRVAPLLWQIASI